MAEQETDLVKMAMAIDSKAEIEVKILVKDGSERIQEKGVEIANAFGVSVVVVDKSDPENWKEYIFQPEPEDDDPDIIPFPIIQFRNLDS